MSDYNEYFEIGAKVTHSVYGEGEITKCDRPHTKLYYHVEFNGHSMSVHHSELTLIEEDNI